MSAFTDQLSSDISSTFLDVDQGFAVNATYTPSGGSASTVKTIFDGPFQALSPEGIEIESKMVSILCKKSDVSAAKIGDTFVISGTTYYVIGGPKANDADDMVRIFLSTEVQHG